MEERIQRDGNTIEATNLGNKITLNSPLVRQQVLNPGTADVEFRVTGLRKQLQNISISLLQLRREIILESVNEAWYRLRDGGLEARGLGGRKCTRNTLKRTRDN